ncbi:hypothetical protein [Streptomyces sp. NPDC002644]
MIISSRVRLSALTLAGALSVALVTGCSSGSDEKSDTAAKPSGASSSAAEAPAAEALSEEELTKLIVASGEVEGYKVAEPGKGDIFSGSWDDVKVEGGDGCKPIVQALSGSPVGGSKADVSRQVTQEKAPGAAKDGEMPSFEDALRMDVTMVTLATYEGDGAQQAVKSVADAVGKCSGGFTFTVPGEEAASYSKVATDKGVAADGSDETVAFGLTGEPFEEGAKPSTVHGQVVRHGNNVVTYLTVNLGNMADGKPYQVSAPVVTAQSKKLG